MLRDARAPALGQLPSQPPGAAGDVRVVGEPVLGLKLAQGVAVGHGEVVVSADHRFERGLPPGQVKLGGDGPGRDLALGEVRQQLPQPVLAHVLDEQRALGQAS